MTDNIAHREAIKEAMRSIAYAPDKEATQRAIDYMMAQPWYKGAVKGWFEKKWLPHKHVSTA